VALEDLDFLLEKMEPPGVRSEEVSSDFGLCMDCCPRWKEAAWDAAIAIQPGREGAGSV
jgi:hypothetical protein